MDDSKTVALSVKAKQPIHGWPNKTVVPRLIIRCKEGKTDTYVETGMPAKPETGKTITVRTRLDDAKAVVAFWDQSTDNAALFAPDAIGLAQKLASTHRFLFEFTPFNSSPAIAEFETDGLEPMLSDISETCGWSKVLERRRKAALEQEELIRSLDHTANGPTGGLEPGMDFTIDGLRVPVPTRAVASAGTDSFDVSIGNKGYDSSGKPLYDLVHFYEYYLPKNNWLKQKGSCWKKDTSSSETTPSIICMEKIDLLKVHFSISK